MDQSRFFRFVWRFNAILLALLGAYLVYLAAWNVIPRARFGDLPGGHFAPVPKSAETKFTYRLEPLAVSVGPEDILSLRRWNGAPSSYGLMDKVEEVRSVGQNAVNLLAVDGTNGASHWLFHGYGRDVLSQDTVTRPDAAGGTAIPIALVIRTIDADTDKDGELTDKDDQSLYVYRPGMSFAVKLLDTDHIISMGQMGDGSYLVICERGASAIAMAFSLPDFKKTSEKLVPTVPN